MEGERVAVSRRAVRGQRIDGRANDVGGIGTPQEQDERDVHEDQIPEQQRRGSAGGNTVSATPPIADRKMPVRRFTELDVFRGIAALTVVLYHYLFRYDQLYGLETLTVESLWLGRYGVHFFFLISGFVICWSLSRSSGIGTFLVSRVSRIYPAYWVALVITFAAMSVFGLPGREVSITAFLVNITMLQEYLGAPHVDGAYWTLTAELTFYFWIVTIHKMGQLHRAELWLLPLMALGVLVHTGLLPMPLMLEKLLLIKHVHLFAAGIVFFRLHEGADGRTARWFLPVSAAVNFAIYPWVDALFICTFYGLLFLAVSDRLGWLCCRPLLWLGSISYSLYLLHQNLGYVIIREVTTLTGSERIGIVAAVVVVLLLSDLLARIVERPAARQLRTFAARALGGSWPGRSRRGRA